MTRILYIHVPMDIDDISNISGNVIENNPRNSYDIYIQGFIPAVLVTFMVSHYVLLIHPDTVFDIKIIERLRILQV